MSTSLDLPAAQSAVERIRLAITDARIAHLAVAAGAFVTARLGVATSTTQDCAPLELTAQADTALYAAEGSWFLPRMAAARPNATSAAKRPDERSC